MKNKVWILFHVVETPATKPDGVDCGGVFSTEEKAIEACHDEYCFIGPLVVDEVLPKEAIEWPGGYYPLANEVD